MSQDNKKFGSCLVVTRHQLMSSQQRDVESICDRIETIAELPVNSQELQKVIEPFDVVIGSFPIQLEIEILKNKKNLVTFVMMSLGVADNREDANKIASQYEGRTAILTPSKSGEKYRVVLYQGLKLIREIKVIDEWIVQHTS